MSTFRLRIRFHVAHKGIISGEGKEMDFCLPNGHVATLHCVDAEKFCESTKFVIISGGYETVEQAHLYGCKIKDAILLYGTKYRVGVDLGKDKASGFLASSVKDKIFNEHGVKMIDDVHGLAVYSEEHLASCLSLSATGLVNVRGAEFLTNEIRDLLCKDIQFDSQIKLAMELMTASFFESSVRARFLTLVLAAESILKPEDRSQNAVNIVDELINRVKTSDITEEEKNSIKGSLRWLYKDSISQSLRKMAARHLTSKTYDGVNPEVFIKRCYEARSKLVHSGSVDESKFNIGTLAANLELYIKDMLIALSGA